MPINATNDLTDIKNAEERLMELNSRMSQELEVASEFQKSLLPTASPYSDKLKSSWFYKLSSELGGDNLNIFHIDDNHIGLYVLDVTGHGVAAALLSVTATHVISGFLRVCCPRDVVEGLNAHFSNKRYKNHSFTLIYGVLSLDDLTLEYTSAGHLGPIRLKPDGTLEQFDGHGPPVGMMEDAEYNLSRIELAKAERIFLLSDGVYEASNSKGETLGLKAVYDVIQKERIHPIEDSVGRIAQRAFHWCLPLKPTDDISILGIEIR